MNIINDDAAQTSAEFILIFGGIIVVVIVAALFYNNYVKGLGGNITSNDLANVTTQITNLNNSFS
jgi:hypothetical protein